MSKTVNNKPQYFYYTEDGPASEYDENGAVQRSYIYEPGFYWQTAPLVQRASDGNYYYLNDHLGTPQKLISVDGSVGWSAKYKGFGDAATSELKAVNPYRFPGQYFDEETWLHQNTFRDFDAYFGGYISIDPVEILQTGPNRYGYSLGNPISLSDPFGLDTYIVNRDLALLGDSACSRNNPITHTYVVTTNKDGSIEHAYSWGNDANLHGWNIDQALDIKTAGEALRKDLADRVGGDELDCFVDQAYNKLNKKENKHLNFFFFSNCKSEAQKLLDEANQLSEEPKRKKKGS